ncbi:hypothetical protein ACFL3F_05205 [Planctomycetota bacterium]
MYQNHSFGRPHFGPDYVPYFYASGRFVLAHDVPRYRTSLTALAGPSSYDFTSDLSPSRRYFTGQSVDQVIRSGYLAIPQSEQETALILDKKHTSRLGLDDVIGQIRNRYELYQKNSYEIELAKCYAVSTALAIESARGGIILNSKEMYGLNKSISELYQQQRNERVNLWRDVSRLRLQLPENAQQYLSAYRKVSILEDDKGETL